ncbi:hypothetical protein J2787_000803 [Chryseobacterium rhizosphaerae]|uniref:Uncharacterized protein n=1 Tax=Chryseobacterium rhizosphaerae TaxID=395937 RepID=A0AAE3Y4T7_9FLAO|nr:MULTISPECIES: hypothetical protein [Chryseobacterium]MBP1165262.1 hypothetical protein [Chryseobacterium sp. PvR013]MDR6525433.1 hypothetical protein [Chryseobacterium rhizosphaerae]BAP31062.1 uncharacterized protein CHSO_2025 [Chryseobacterium sp. StRB126]
MTKRVDYYYLPKKYWKKHNYCEFVINQIEELILDERFIELKIQTFEFSKDVINKIDVSDKHLFDRLSELGFNNELTKVVRTHLILSLIMETCYFIQESLLCSLKMRMTVCFTLLRKPFLEILILVMRILNESDFIDKFNNLEGFDPIKTTPNEKKDLITKTNNLLKDLFNNEDLYQYIFDKEFGDSLFNITNNAIHLYTDRNPVSATEKQNLNFIFSTRENIDDMWEYIYHNIPMLLTFLAFSIDLLVLKSTTVDEDIFLKRHKMREKLRKRYKVE